MKAGAGAKASLNKAQSVAVDPKPGELSMARAKRDFTVARRPEPID